MGLVILYKAANFSKSLNSDRRTNQSLSVINTANFGTIKPAWPDGPSQKTQDDSFSYINLLKTRVNIDSTVHYFDFG
jgi:hypothetical protein